MVAPVTAAMLYELGRRAFVLRYTMQMMENRDGLASAR